MMIRIRIETTGFVIKLKSYYRSYCEFLYVYELKYSILSSTNVKLKIIETWHLRQHYEKRRIEYVIKICS